LHPIAFASHHFSSIRTRDDAATHLQAEILRASLFSGEQSPEDRASYLDFRDRDDNGNVEFRHDLKVLVVSAVGRCPGALEAVVTLRWLLEFHRKDLDALQVSERTRTYVLMLVLVFESAEGMLSALLRIV
jgi:hypothetical protein